MSTENKGRVLRHAFVVALLAFLGAPLMACPGDLENAAAFTTAGAGGGSGCGDVETTLIGARCATANCHDSTTHAQDLDLTPGSGLAAKLVNVPGTLSACPGTLVDPAAPENSLMYTKTTATACGIQMPASGKKLTEAEQECLLEWITGL